MPTLCLVLAAISTIAAADRPSEEPRALLLEPPAELPWPSGLPSQLTLDGPASCAMLDNGDVVPLSVGIFLPEKLANHVEDRLRYLDSQPGLCKAKLDGLDVVCSNEKRRDAATCEAGCNLRVKAAVADAPGFTYLEGLGLVAAGVLVGGLAIGLAVGFTR